MLEIQEAFRKRIAGIQQDRGKPITAGKCKDMSDYLGQCGVLIGLEVALMEFDDLIAQYTTEERDTDGL